ncbi:MAG: response regulator [Synergistaceae bacterium]|jgi:putative two-component system response regulator|nr:response regulator [Synergistaceae bacterium]
MKDILVVDDNIASLKQIASFLAGSYGYSLVSSGREAISVCAQSLPDLILLDVKMPDMDGFETLAALRKNPVLSDVPVIFLSSSRDNAVEVKSFRAGAMDFIKKPVERSILLHRLELHLNISAYQSALADSVKAMADNLASSIAELIECRDEETGGHVVRTSRYVEMLGKELMEKELFLNELSGPALEMMVRAAPLHDIGKIAISDRILLKADRLDDEEFAVMKKHASIGAEILENMYARTPSQTYLRYAVMIAESHHEQWSGKGYPRGTAGEEIPLCARIMAVADVYDALVSNRIYRRGMNAVEAFHIVMEGRGTQFDPRVVDAFRVCCLKFPGIDGQAG